MDNSLKKNEIILINTLMCILVVFVHVSGDPVTTLDKTSIQYLCVMIPWRLSAFAVQGFIFLSALKLFLKDMPKFSYKGFILKRIRVVLIPYLIWVMVYYVYFCNIGYFSFSFGDYIKYVLNGSIVSPFYFIVTIFQFYILMPLWIKLLDKVPAHILAVVSFVIMILSKMYLPKIALGCGIEFQYFDRIFPTYLFYWIAGCCAGRYYQTFKLYIEKYYFSELLMFICATGFDIYLSYRSFVYGENIPYLEYIHVLYCVSVISFIYNIALKLVKTGFSDNRLIKSVNSASYYIFLMHCLIINIVNEIIKAHNITDIGTSYFIRFVSVYIITLTLCILYVKIKKSIKLKISAGGKKI
jgi:membrane-bound acyltransferase YfiQ involved in biofilm formation